MMFLPIFELKHYHQMLRDGSFPESLGVNFLIPLPSIGLALFTLGASGEPFIDAPSLYLGMAGILISGNMLLTMPYLSIAANELSETRW